MEASNWLFRFFHTSYIVSCNIFLIHCIALGFNTIKTTEWQRKYFCLKPLWLEPDCQRFSSWIKNMRNGVSKAQIKNASIHTKINETKYWVNSWLNLWCFDIYHNGIIITMVFNLICLDITLSIMNVLFYSWNNSMFIKINKSEITLNALWKCFHFQKTAFCSDFKLLKNIFVDRKTVIFSLCCTC